MDQEDIISVRDKNCPEWLCDAPSEPYLLNKVAKLEAEIERLKQPKQDCDLCETWRGSPRYTFCPDCGNQLRG